MLNDRLWAGRLLRDVSEDCREESERKWRRKHSFEDSRKEARQVWIDLSANKPLMARLLCLLKANLEQHPDTVISGRHVVLVHFKGVV